MNTCHKCGEVYDTDFQMETDKDGNMICDKCWEESTWIEPKESDATFKGRGDF